MWKNKLNGKEATKVSFENSIVYFTIDGIGESLPLEIFEEYYERIS